MRYVYIIKCQNYCFTSKNFIIKDFVNVFLTVYLLITVHFSEYGLFKSSMLENVLTDNVEAAKR